MEQIGITFTKKQIQIVNLRKLRQSQAQLIQKVLNLIQKHITM